MKLKYFFTLVAICFFSVAAFSKIADNEIIGSWKYKISDVPPEYETGIMSFVQKDDKTVGFIGDGAERRLEMKELKITENKVSFKLPFESGIIEVNLVKDGDKMTGKLKTDDGEFPIGAEKQVKK